MTPVFPGSLTVLRLRRPQADFGLALAGFVALLAWKAPPVLVVFFAAVAAALVLS